MQQFASRAELVRLLVMLPFGFLLARAGLAGKGMQGLAGAVKGRKLWQDPSGPSLRRSSKLRHGRRTEHKATIGHVSDLAIAVMYYIRPKKMSFLIFAFHV